MKFLADVLHFLDTKDSKGNPVLPTTSATKTELDKILTEVFITLGAIALLMIVIGGLRFVFARDDPQRVATAKNVIIYSVIGLVLAASAALIVNVVLGKVQ